MCFIDITIKDITIYHYCHCISLVKDRKALLSTTPLSGKASTKKAPGNLKKNRHRSDFRGQRYYNFSIPI